MVFWASVIGGLSALDVWCHRNETTGDTLSECLRLVYHTETSRLGRAAFLLTWAGLTCWFVPHINRRVAEIVDG